MGTFRRLWLAQSMSVLGDYIAMFAVQSLVTFRMHGSAKEITGVLLASLAPAAVLSPVAGAWVDRANPVRVMIGSDVLRAALIAAFVFATRPWELYALSFAVSCASAFFIPCLARAIPLVAVESGAADTAVLLRANARLQQSAQAARIVSPAAAAVLAAWAGEKACFLVDAGTFMFSAAMITGLKLEGRLDHESRRAIAGLRSLGRELAEAIRFAGRNEVLRFGISVLALATLAAACFSALAPLYARDVLAGNSMALMHLGRSRYALMGMLIPVGGLLGSVLAGRTKSMKDWNGAPVVLSIGTASAGACILSMAAVPRMSVAALACLGLGASAAYSLTHSAAVIQGQTPARLRGRVSAAYMAAMSVAQAAGVLSAGAVASRTGVRTVYAISAMMLLLPLACRCFRRETSRSGLAASSQILPRRPRGT